MPIPCGRAARWARVWLLATALMLGASAPLATAALAAENVSGPRGQYTARLDRLLAERQFSELGDAMTDVPGLEEMGWSLDWSKAKLMAGGSLYIAAIYAENLWWLANSRREASELKDTAGFIVLYGLLRIDTDGLRCEDRTAPSSHRNQWLTLFRDEIRHAAQSEPSVRESMLLIAFRMEELHAESRADDYYLCSGGIAEFSDYFDKHGPEGLTETTDPRILGRVILVPEDPNFVPKFLPKERWLPRQQAAREEARRGLRQLLEVMRSAPGAHP